MTNSRTEREQQLYSSTTTHTATTTPATTGSSSRLCQEMEEDWEPRYFAEQIREMHMENFGRKMPPSIHRRVLKDLINGTPYEYYAYAIEQASMAPYPSWRYVEAVIGRLTREKVKPDSLMYWL